MPSRWESKLATDAWYGMVAVSGNQCYFANEISLHHHFTTLMIYQLLQARSRPVTGKIASKALCPVTHPEIPAICFFSDVTMVLGENLLCATLC